MKRVIICVSVPLMLVVLGWLAIANAQKLGVGVQPAGTGDVTEDESSPVAPDVPWQHDPFAGSDELDPRSTTAPFGVAETSSAHEFDEVTENDQAAIADSLPAGESELENETAVDGSTVRPLPWENDEVANENTSLPGANELTDSPVETPQSKDRSATIEPDTSEDDVPFPVEDPFGLQSLPLRPEAESDEAAPAATGEQEADPSKPFNSLREEPAAITEGPAQPLPFSGAEDYSRADVSPTGDQAVGSGVPGGVSLEGIQAPTLSVEKIAPVETQVGREAIVQIVVKNMGASALEGILIRDIVPQGTKLVSTVPEAVIEGGESLTWELPTLGVGEQAIVEMRVVPQYEGEIGSVATVVFQQQVSARTEVTRPELELQVAGPREVLMGEAVTLSIRLTNKGSGTAADVVLEELIPAEFRHPAGREIELVLGSLEPGETVEKELTLTAIQPGVTKNILRARGEGEVYAESQLEMEITAPQLAVVVNGPDRRYLETKAQFEIAVSNPGTASAENIRLVAHLSKGLKFVEANNAGYYDPGTHAVHWNLVELPAQRSGSVSLIAEPVEIGQESLQIEADAPAGVSDRVEHSIDVKGIAALYFEVADVEDPIAAGDTTTYEVRVVNQGTKAATGVQLLATLPAEMTLVEATGATKHSLQGKNVAFQPLRSLAPKADTTYKLRIKAERPGDLRLRVQVVADELDTPVTKEESTRVYSLD